MANIKFETDDHKVEIRSFLPRKYAKIQLGLLLEGVKIKGNTQEIEEVDAKVALESLDVLVDGMVLSLDGDSNNVYDRLQEIDDRQYQEIATKCAEIREANSPKAPTTSN